METTYKIQGSDGKEYGPVALAQLQAWINDGRVGRDQQILRSDQNAWNAAGSFAELQFSAPAVTATVQTPPTLAPSANAERAPLEHRVKSGASWFYWIAALSVVNSAASWIGTTWGFILGLSITRIIDAFAAALGSTGMVVGIALDLIVAGVLVLFGVIAQKKHAWSFIMGMVLYALDGLISVVGRDWLSVGFHVFALFCILNGFKALRQLQSMTNGRS